MMAAASPANASTVSPSPVASGPRAFLRVGGMSVARHQLGLVLALGCERIICIASTLDAELVTMQHVAEKAGVQFHVVPGVRALAGLVSAADELIILSEALLAMPADAVGLLEAGSTVLVLPAESGIPAGFERIDLNHAAAGAMRLPGRLAQQLEQLPSDCDAASSLMRIALQAGVTQKMVPPASRETARWTLVRDEAEAHAIETPWMVLHTATKVAVTPGRWIARLVVRRIGPSLLHAGSNANIIVLAAAVTMLMSIGAGWFGYAAAALMLAGFGWTIRQSAALLSRVEHDSLQSAPSRWPREVVFSWLFDCALVAILCWGIDRPLWQTPLEHIFPPLMLVSLLRLLPRMADTRWAVWLEDRLLGVLVLATAAIAGALGETVYITAVTLALAGIVAPRISSQITRV